MTTQILQWGNSKAIRLPKLLLEESGLPETIELVVVGDTIVIRPARKPREGWAEAFAAMREDSDREWAWEGLIHDETELEGIEWE